MPRLAAEVQRQHRRGQPLHRARRTGSTTSPTSSTATGGSSEQAKLHITPSEPRWWGTRAGRGVHVFDTDRGKRRDLDLLRQRVPRGRADRDAEGGADPVRPVLHGQPAGPPPRDALRPGPRHREPALRRDERLRRATSRPWRTWTSTTRRAASSRRATSRSRPTASPGECEPNIETVVVADLDLETLRRNRSTGPSARGATAGSTSTRSSRRSRRPRPPRRASSMPCRRMPTTRPHRASRRTGRVTRPPPRPDPAPPAACRAATTRR